MDLIRKESQTLPRISKKARVRNGDVGVELVVRKDIKERMVIDHPPGVYQTQRLRMEISGEKELELVCVLRPARYA